METDQIALGLSCNLLWNQSVKLIRIELKTPTLGHICHHWQTLLRTSSGQLSCLHIFFFISCYLCLWVSSKLTSNLAVSWCYYTYQAHSVARFFFCLWFKYMCNKHSKCEALSPTMAYTMILRTTHWGYSLVSKVHNMTRTHNRKTTTKRENNKLKYDLSDFWQTFWV